MQLFVGTSGYSYKEWKGRFYPEKLPQRDMLEYYSQRFSTVEANNTFRQMPSASVLKSWTQQVPVGFRFALKAPQTITHFKRLRNVGAATKDFFRAASVLKQHLGPVLFQLPPNFKKDLPRLRAFLRLVSKRRQVAFEFRHASWFDDEVFGCLRARSCALCIADVDNAPRPPMISTARWGYLRLRRKRYTHPQLAEWIERIQSQPWNEAYVFFKHEETGTGPRFAKRFLDLAAGDSVR
ncbi:MAG TPA: DUF72 domain-containing protein [Planctomycetaceae bacterium]